MILPPQRGFGSMIRNGEEHTTCDMQYVRGLEAKILPYRKGGLENVHEVPLEAYQI